MDVNAPPSEDRKSILLQPMHRVDAMRRFLFWASFGVLVGMLSIVVLGNNARKTAEETLAEKRRIVLLLRLHENAMKRGTDQIIGVREELYKDNPEDKPVVEALYWDGVTEINLPYEPLLIIGPDTSKAAERAYLSDSPAFRVNADRSPILMVSVTGVDVRRRLEERFNGNRFARIRFAGPSNEDAANKMREHIEIREDCANIAFSVNQADKYYSEDLYKILRDKFGIESTCRFPPLPESVPIDSVHSDGDGGTKKTNGETCVRNPSQPYCAWILIGNAEWYKEQKFEAVDTKTILVSDGISGEQDNILKIYEGSTIKQPELKSVRASVDGDKTGCMGQRFWGKIAGRVVDAFWKSYVHCTRNEQQPEVECRFKALADATKDKPTFEVKTCN